MSNMSSGRNQKMLLAVAGLVIVVIAVVVIVASQAPSGNLPTFGGATGATVAGCTFSSGGSCPNWNFQNAAFPSKTTMPTGFNVSGSNFTGAAMPSLGVHDHWNNAVDKQYGRNLGQTNGIELLYAKLSKTAPRLAMRRTEQGVAISWPTSHVGYRLQSATSLSASANWTPRWRKRRGSD